MEGGGDLQCAQAGRHVPEGTSPWLSVARVGTQQSHTGRVAVAARARKTRKTATPGLPRRRRICHAQRPLGAVASAKRDFDGGRGGEGKIVNLLVVLCESVMNFLILVL